MSLIDLATRQVTATWKIGGSPDMISVSPDGSQLWISNRYSWHGSVSVVDASNGQVISLIKTGGQPHGLAYWPQPGVLSLGHNGNMR
jgi:YVTN family beta-propeller protein